MHFLKTTRHWLVPVIFLSVFVILNVYVGQLHFYIDDFPYALDPPSLTKNFFSFVSSYTTIHGIYRPFALLYYWFIYSMYWISPMISHAIPLGLHVLSGYLLYLIGKKQHMTESLALIVSLLFTLHPFATEQYMWFSANPGTIVNLLFFLQILIILRATNLKHILILLAVFSFVSIFLYESTFFMFIPFSYLILSKFKSNLIDKFKISLALLLPVFAYIVAKFFIHGTDPRPLVDSITLLIHHAYETMDNLMKVHIDPYYLQQFWASYGQSGWELLKASPLIIALTLLLIFVITITIFRDREQQKPGKQTMLFWLLVFGASVLPLLANKVFYFGFRSLFLPTISAIILFFLFIQWLSGKNLFTIVRIASISVLILFLSIDIAIANKYLMQFGQDMALSQKIDQIIVASNLGNTYQSLNILLKSDMPFDSRDTFLHADHILSCFFYEWSAPACLRMVTNEVDTIAIEHSDGRKTINQGKQFDDIYTKSPLLLLHLTKSNDVYVDKIEP